MSFFNKKTVALFVIVGIAVAGAFFVLIKKGVTKKEINKSQQETTKQTQEIDSDAIQKQVTTENGFLETEMLISAEGAIDLVVIDPDKNTITAETIIPSEFEFIRAIPGVLYYSEMEQGRDSNPIIRVYSYRARIGDYTIKIVINPNKAINPAITTSTRAVFWLDFSVGGQSLNLANGTGWADIPMYGYGVRVNTDGSLVAIAPHRTSEVKMYTNTEFGFEFQYPEELVIRENTFGSYYSKFNLEVVAREGEFFAPVLSVNVVLPEFPERSFRGVEKTTSEVTVDGIVGTKYEYEFEDLPEIAIILPLGQYKIVLGMPGTTRPYAYLDTFNQILNTFRFTH